MVDAWQVTGAGEPREVLVRGEAALPDELPPGQLRLRVLAASVGYPDVAMCRGSYALTPSLPFTPGQELVGVVTATGPGCVNRVGARVIAVSSFTVGHGSFARECLAGDDFALEVPDDMTDAEAAAFHIPSHTGWVALARRARLRPRESLLVLGAAGGTGSVAVQIGKALGARVIATAGGPDKVEFCRSLGADEVIDYRTDEIAPAVLERTGGRGVDVAYDPVGGDAFVAATRCIAYEGRLLAIGFAGGQWGRPSLAHLVTRNYSVVGVMPGKGYDRRFKEWSQASLLALWRAGRLRIPVWKVFGFDDVPAAVDEVAAGRMMGKVVVQVAG